MAQETPSKPLDPEIRRRLVGLRWLLVEALERTRDASQLGRHVALVLLDGACERAMAIATDELGLPHKLPTKFEDLGSNLIEKLGPEWHKSSWRGVRTLHDMRNQAQHVEGVADIDQVRGWARDVDRFVHALVERVYHCDLRTLTLSAAIEDDNLRSLLTDAETALEQEDVESAFDLASEAFATARARWRPARDPSTRARLSRLRAMSSFSLGEGFSDEEAGQKASEALDLLSAFAFAPEPAEYVWFRDLQAARRQGAPVEREDAARALAFSFTWVLRFENFAARHDPDRARRWYEHLKPAQLDEIEGAVVLPGDVSVEARHGRDGEEGRLLADISCHIINVDPPDMDAWVRAVQEKVRATTRDLIGDGHVSLARDGTVAFHRVPVSIDVPQLIAAVHEALNKGEASLEQAHRRDERWESEKELLIAPFRDALVDIHLDGEPAFGEVTAEPAKEWPDDPRAFTISVSVPEDSLAAPTSLSIAAHNLSRSMRATVGSGSGTIRFSGDQDPTAVRELVLAAVEEVTIRRREVRAMAAKRQEEAERLRRELAATLQPGRRHKPRSRKAI